jgi:hypothetical protein
VNVAKWEAGPLARLLPRHVPLWVTSPVTAVVARQEAGPLARLLLRHVPLRRRSRRPERDQEAGPLARLLLRHVPCVGTPRPVTSGWVTSPSHGDPWSRRAGRGRARTVRGDGRNGLRSGDRGAVAKRGTQRSTITTITIPSKA